MSQTFPCPACGAPIEPTAGASALPCPYCLTQVTIPEASRLSAAPPPPAERVERPKYVRPEIPPMVERKPEEEISAMLRQAQPYAQKAVGAWAGWVLIQRFLPGCITLIVLTCFLGCGLIVFLASALQQ
jgi:predicted RNA-binding Zn-ribbon protein involved in translation (DUF1610 family)